ncbi:MAG: DNA-binding protein [Ignavibacteria bacterium]|nr:DNA-binding protein [Ignavibacteria bacterium]
MAVQFKAVARVNPADRTKPPKFYAQAVSNGQMTLRQLAKRISDMSTVSSIDALAVLEGMLQVIPEELGNGKIVRLGEFGSFSVSIKSEAFDAPDNIKSNSGHGVKMQFRPGALVKEKLNAMTFEKIS